jgi:hypothetical protein
MLTSDKWDLEESTLGGRAHLMNTKRRCPDVAIVTAFGCVPFVGHMRMRVLLP